MFSRILLVSTVPFFRIIYCVKSVHIRSFPGPYFFAFGLNRKTYGLCGNAVKYGPEKLPNTDTFHVVIISSMD